MQAVSVCLHNHIFRSVAYTRLCIAVRKKNDCKTIGHTYIYIIYNKKVVVVLAQRQMRNANNILHYAHDKLLLFLLDSLIRVYASYLFGVHNDVINNNKKKKKKMQYITIAWIKCIYAKRISSKFNDRILLLKFNITLK